MKRKGLTIGLIIVVCTIWGAVLSKAVWKHEDTDPEPIVTDAFTAPETARDSLPHADELGNYRDPFLGKTTQLSTSKRIVATSLEKTTAAQHKQTMPASTNPWPRMEYIGSMKNGKGDRGVALLTTGGGPLTLLQGVESDGFTALVIAMDSVIIVHDGEQRTFRRSQ